MSCAPVTGLVLEYDFMTGQVVAVTSAWRDDCCIINLELFRQDDVYGHMVVENAVIRCLGGKHTFRHSDFNHGVTYKVTAVVMCKDCTLSPPTTAQIVIP